MMLISSSGTSLEKEKTVLFSASKATHTRESIWMMLRMNSFSLRMRRKVAACSAACLLVFGPDGFLIPSMALILAVLLVFRGRMDPAGKGEEP